MRTKFSRILVAALILTLALTVFAACNTGEQSLDGMYIVTFKFNGGVLDNSATNVLEEIQHAYKPNSLVIDISSYNNYKFTKSGYVFDGWYTDTGLTHKWDFSKDRVTENVTLYAKWISEIVYSYTLYFINEKGEPVQFARYTVNEGDPFSGTLTSGAVNELRSNNRTFLGDFFQDKFLNVKWDDSFVHPGGATSVDVPVYVNTLEGIWTLVRNYQELKSASGNIWLMNDIDCEGNELYLGDFNNTLQGNGFTVSNFKVVNSHSNTSRPQFAIFGSLGEKAKLEKVTFANAQFEISSWLNTTEIRVAALAVEAATGCVINDVSVSGKYSFDFSATTNETFLQEFQSAVAKINQALYEPNGEIDLTKFSADIQLKQD